MARKRDVQADIARNKREGLLCACNAVRVPYYGTDGLEGTGVRVVDGVCHGYDDCHPTTTKET
jgi:hypothetical protein